jgi:hypothetical protein
MRRKFVKGCCYLLLLSMLTFLLACADINNVADPSVPGIVRVVLQADPSDTEMVILGETVVVAEGDSLGINVFQGKAWSVQDDYAILFKDVDSYYQDQYMYNVIKQDNNLYLPYVVFESFVPAGNYKAVSMGLDALHLQIDVYNIPLTLPQGDDKIMTFEADYTVSEYNVTEIIIRLKPFASMTRYRDEYVFDRVAEVFAINYFGRSEYDKIVAGLPYIINPNDPWTP